MKGSHRLPGAAHHQWRMLMNNSFFVGDAAFLVSILSFFILGSSVTWSHFKTIKLWTLTQKKVQKSGRIRKTRLAHMHSTRMNSEIQGRMPKAKAWGTYPQELCNSSIWPYLCLTHEMWLIMADWQWTYFNLPGMRSHWSNWGQTESQLVRNLEIPNYAIIPHFLWIQLLLWKFNC